MSSTEQGPAPPARSGLALLGQLVMIPLVIVTIGLAVFVLFGLVASEQRRPQDYLQEIRNGNATRRWQAAFELARELAQSDAPARSDLVPRIVETFEWARDEDPKVRRYLAQALGTLGDQRAIPALERALEDPDTDTRLWSASALGNLGDAAVGDSLRRLLADEDPAVRKQAAHSLAVLDVRDARDDVAQLLDDSVVDVRWNGAISLAWLDDDRGVPVLLAMLDRDRMAAIPEVRNDQTERAMVSALAALARLRTSEARETIAGLAASDSSLRVRQAAMSALEQMEAPVETD